MKSNQSAWNIKLCQTAGEGDLLVSGMCMVSGMEEEAQFNLICWDTLGNQRSEDGDTYLPSLLPKIVRCSEMQLEKFPSISFSGHVQKRLE